MKPSTKLTALFLRGASMGAKFLLVVGLSKELTPSDYGIFSLILTTLTFLIFIVGFDFYNFSNREIIDNEIKKASLLFNQFCFHSVCYVICFPLIFPLFHKMGIATSYILPFFVLLVLEHIGQEIFRLFNLFNKPNVANLTLIFRTALWITIMLLFERVIFHRDITIQAVLFYWIGGSSLSITYSLYHVCYVQKIRKLNTNDFKINKKWIAKGIKISSPFFVGTVAYKLIEYSDRYIIDLFLNKEQVGVYSFFANISNIINVVVSTLTIALMVPNLMRDVNSKINTRIKASSNRFFKDILITTLCVGIFILGLIFPIMNWLENPIYSEKLSSYYVLVLANVFLNISLFYHFLLYSYKKDKAILMPTIYAALLNIGLNFIFIPRFGVIAAAYSTLISFFLIFILKYANWNRIKNQI